MSSLRHTEDDLQAFVERMVELFHAENAEAIRRACEAYEDGSLQREWVADLQRKDEEHRQRSLDLKAFGLGEAPRWVPGRRDQSGTLSSTPSSTPSSTTSFSPAADRNPKRLALDSRGGRCEYPPWVSSITAHEGDGARGPPGLLT